MYLLCKGKLDVSVLQDHFGIRIKTELTEPTGLSVLRCVGTASSLLVLWVRILPGSWMSAFCECCVLLGSVLCDGPIPHPEKIYQLCVCVCVCVCECMCVCVCVSVMECAQVQQ